jgi:C4-dicarboxylate-specific signal transduction histidine kinase
MPLSRWLPFRRDLGLQLFALYLLFVGPVIVAALVFDALAGARLERDARAADLALARSIALETNAALENALLTVQTLAQSPEVLSLEPARLRPLFSAVVAARSEVNLVYVLDARGIMHYHYPEGPGSTVGIDFSGREYYQRALQGQRPLMSVGRISPTTQKPVSTAVMPLRSAGGEWRGLVATNLNLEQLSATLAAIASDPETGVRVSIVDSIGQIVADSRPIALPSDGAAEFPVELASMLRGAATRAHRHRAG